MNVCLTKLNHHFQKQSDSINTYHQSNKTSKKEDLYSIKKEIKNRRINIKRNKNRGKRITGDMNRGESGMR